jgi:hypothetical protein
LVFERRPFLEFGERGRVYGGGRETTEDGGLEELW